MKTSEKKEKMTLSKAENNSSDYIMNELELILGQMSMTKTESKLKL